jgi:hypothetical protein
VASAGGGASSAGEEKARAGACGSGGLGIACVCGELKPGREEGKR